jgi:hypothetical protein
VATTLTRNLKLRINSNLTADAKFNLEKIDALGSTFLVDSTDTLNIRSRSNISIEPDSADLGGNSTGGSLNIGNGSHLLASVAIHSDSTTLSSPLGLKDQAAGGNKHLLIQYKSDSLGSADTTQNRTFSIDPQGGNRSLLLEGDLSLAGGSITFTTAAGSSVTVPATGTLATLAGTETLTNKTINASQNTILNLTNSAIAAGAGIVYSKLLLTDSILNSDINSAAAIQYSKLNLNGSIVNSDIANSAAIARSKLASGTLNHVLINNGDGALSSEAQLAITRGGTGAGTVIEALNNLLPPQLGQDNRFLKTDGSNVSWELVAGGGGSVLEAEAVWTNAEGTTKVVTHNLNSNNIDISIIDLDDNSLINIDSIVVTNSNSVSLSSSEAPGSSWRVIIQANP